MKQLQANASRKGRSRRILDSQPSALPGVLGYWFAFNDLHPTRVVGFQVGAIQFSEIVAWLDLHGITDTSERVDYATVIRALDSVYLAWAREQAPTDGRRSPDQHPD